VECHWISNATDGVRGSGRIAAEERLETKSGKDRGCHGHPVEQNRAAHNPLGREQPVRRTM
jgi:hypothetical protein